MLATLAAPRLLGPLRALLLSGAPIALSSGFRAKKISIFRLLLTIIALHIVVYDAMGRTTTAIIVRDSVLRNQAARVVRSKLNSVGHDYVTSLKGTWGSFRQHHRNMRDAQEPTVPDENAARTNGRRLLAIVKDNILAQIDENQSDKLTNDQRQRKLQAAHQPEQRNQHQQHDSNTIKQHQTANDARDPFVDGPAPHEVIDVSRNATNSSVGDDLVVDRALLATESPASPLSATIGVLLAVIAPFMFRAANDMTYRIAHDVGDWPLVTAAVYLTSAIIMSPVFLAFFLRSIYRDELRTFDFFSRVVPLGIASGFCLAVTPLLLHVSHNGLLNKSSSHQQRPSKLTLSKTFSLLLSSSNPSRSIDVSVTSPTHFYAFILLSTFIINTISHAAFDSSDSFTFSSCTAALILLIQSLPPAPASSEPGHRRRGTLNLSSSDLSVYLRRSPALGTKYLWMLVKQIFPTSIHSFRDLADHARSNKASWQVLNFLILQIGMASVELVYASITQSTGLFSISADNFFCSIALAIGLYATRLSSKQPTITFTYGFSRAESLCGFTNGVMLIYVAILIFLEAYERQNGGEEIAFARAFSVCLFGVLGNVLGLFFFPPETRRENHNVQGIYLHIWANTLAFASMAVSIAVTASIPTWGAVDLITSALVAFGIVALAVPLLVRSARLLLLMPPTEKEPMMRSTRERLAQIAGVVNVSALRVWNLTPNHLVSSVKMEVSSKFEGDDEEVLYRARSVFARLGISASHCTIQVTRVDATLPDSVIFLHKRSRSAVPDTGINMDQLYGSANQSTQNVDVVEPKPTGSLTLLTV